MALVNMKKCATDNAVEFLHKLKDVPFIPDGHALYLKYKNKHKDFKTEQECINKTHGSITILIEILSEAYEINEDLHNELESPIVHFNTVSKYYWTLALDCAWILEEGHRKYISKICLAKVFNEVGSYIYEYL
jgi:hypothetical protein